MSVVVYLSGVGVYQKENLVLDKVNLNLNEGEFVYLIGKTGSGKTSLLKTLYAQLPLKEGTAQIGDFNIKDIDRKQIPFLRRSLGIVFQDFRLLEDRNIEENLAFVLRATGWKETQEIQLKIREVLAKVGLPEKGYRMPHELSGGEQQKVVIARALLNSPKIILADEPTGNLDPDTSNEIISLLHQLAKEENTAILMATHDYRIIQQFPARTIRCQNARLIEVESVVS